MNKIILFMPFLLSACFRGVDIRPDDHGVVEAKAPVINLPPPQNINTDGLEKNIRWFQPKQCLSKVLDIILFLWHIQHSFKDTIRPKYRKELR